MDTRHTCQPWLVDDQRVKHGLPSLSTDSSARRMSTSFPWSHWALEAQKNAGGLNLLCMTSHTHREIDCPYLIFILEGRQSARYTEIPNPFFNPWPDHLALSPVLC